MLPHNYQVEDIFATKIYYCSVSNYSAIQKELLDAYDKIEFESSHKKGWGQTQLLSDPSFRENFLDEYECNLFKEELKNHVYTYVSSYHTQRLGELKCKISSSWLTCNKKGHYAIAHCHGESDISGVYYIKKKDNDGSIYFNTTIHASCGNKLYSDNRLSYNFLEGDLVLFPGFLEHGVHTNETEEDRISLSFNINLE